MDFVVRAVSITALLAALSIVWSHDLLRLWNEYHASKPINDIIDDSFKFLGALTAFFLALKQISIASSRHKEQTEADRERRITESFSKAVEQLGSEKIELRLGGIYTLERISLESQRDYWPIMETLAAFVRERSVRKGQSCATLQPPTDEKSIVVKGPATDIAAVLTVIMRRHRQNHIREEAERWRFDFECADLAGAFLMRANFPWALLRGANLRRCHLVMANLQNANLSSADLRGANLGRAFLYEANLAEADFRGAHLWRANFLFAHLYKANLSGVDLQEVSGLSQDQIESARGDGSTKLPASLTRPVHWTATDPPEAASPPGV
jgi:Pentapeptide repeats (8 copies)